MTLSLVHCEGRMGSIEASPECHSPGDAPGDAHTSVLEGRLGFIQQFAKKPTVGFEFGAALGGPVIEIVCQGVTATVTGSFIGAVPTSEADKSVSSYRVYFFSTKQHPVPAALEGGESPVMQLNVEGAPEPAKNTGWWVAQGSAPEIKAIP